MNIQPPLLAKFERHYIFQHYKLNTPDMNPPYSAELLVIIKFSIFIKLKKFIDALANMTPPEIALF